MSARTGAHQLSNGLVVSGRPESQPKDRPSIVASRAVPYTGGDVKKSGELGKMYGIDISTSDPARPPSRQLSGPNTRSGPHSGPMGPIPKKSSSSSFSGPMTPIQPTGLITSGPVSSTRSSGQLDGQASSFKKTASYSTAYGAAVTTLKREDVKYGFNVSRVAVWAFLVVVVMGAVVGGFLVASVKKVVVLAAVVAVVLVVLVLAAWNLVYRKRAMLGFLKKWNDAELRGAADGQYVKVTGVVTCGSIPLETSFGRVPRCTYVSSELYEYRGCGGKPAYPRHRFLSWGCRHSEKHVADFYISDFQSGLRALVKAGYGAKVAPFVEPNVVVDVNKDNKNLSPSFLRWLADRGLSSDDRVMRLKEGYIKEGCTVSVMGVVRRQDNVLMIVPPSEPVSIGCRWLCFLLPTYIQGLILLCDQSQNGDAIPV